jgi:hypothetical protein
MKVARFILAWIFAAAALVGFFASWILALNPPEDPHHGDPWILLPYAVVLFAMAAGFLSREEKNNDSR